MRLARGMRPGDPGGAGRRGAGDVAQVRDELDVARRQEARERGALLELHAESQLFHRITSGRERASRECRRRSPRPK